MKIGPENNRTSLRRWGVPLGVAAGVAAMSVGAVAVFGGIGDAKPRLAEPAGNPASASASPSPSAAHGSTPAKTDPDAFTITSGTTTPIEAGTATKVLASCLGSDASRYHTAVAVHAPSASKNWDGAVVAVDSAGQYVQCESKGDKGTSMDVPPTFINNRLWSTGRKIEYFDSMRDPIGTGKYVMLGAGHYTSDIAKITISYGDDPKQYPAVMAGGAFAYAATLSTTDLSPHYVGPSPYVHAYNASGAEIYNQQKDPQFADN